MSKLRVWHSYIGLFSAPSILFFAVTGSLQLFNLHEQHGDYQPPALVEKMGRMHKDQVFALDDHDDATKPAPANSAAAENNQAKPAHEDDAPPLSTQALKWFFLVIAINLIASTALGIWIGISHLRRRRTAWVLLLAGALIPMGLSLL